MNNYLSHLPHRNKNPEKSQWTISIDEEVSIFRASENNQWLFATHGWGLNIRNNYPQNLGFSKDGNYTLFIAKFVGADSINWHGYPADHQTKNQDIPDEIILSAWITLSILPRAKIRKIAKGQKCNL